jgi:uncharacterized membrane protein
MRGHIKSIFVEGIKTIIPIGLTLALTIWILHAIETFFGWLIRLVLPAKYYFPGLGLIVGIVAVFFIGVAMRAWFTRKLYELGEKILRKIPFVKTIYGGLMDLMSFFDSKKMKEAGQVVMVSVAGTRMMGLLTRDDFSELPAGIGKDEEVAVFIPLAYQIGGMTVWVPRDKVEKVDMSVDHAMRFAITAGMINGK